MNSGWHIGIAIPARDEEELIPRCLQSLLLAKDRVIGSASVDIIVVSDSSTDRTSEIATKLLGVQGAVKTISAAAVGVARRVGVRYLLDRYRGPLHRCWIANTDADCEVPDNWLSEQLRLAQHGVEAFAGTVDVDHFSEHGPEVAARFRSTYVIRPDGSHPHVHGANVGFRADAYLHAGGWGELCTAEDHDLWRRLAMTGARQHSTSNIEVWTSGRRVGRAPHGFADALAAHNETAA